MFIASVRELVFAGAGFVGGAFTPSIGRKIKTALTKLFTKAESDLESRVKALEAKIVTDGTAAIKAAEAEVKKAV